jgi:hypothetical protein
MRPFVTIEQRRALIAAWLREHVPANDRAAHAIEKVASGLADLATVLRGQVGGLDGLENEREPDRIRQLRHHVGALVGLVFDKANPKKDRRPNIARAVARLVPPKR